MSTIQLTVVTPGAFGAVAPLSRIDRTIDEALNVLAWEGVVVLGLLIVLAPFALVAFAAWLGRRPTVATRRSGSSRRSSRPRRPRVARPERRDERLRHDLERTPRDLARLAEPCEGLFLGEAFALMRIPFARSIALRAASASARESASSRSARSSSCRAVAVAIAGSRSVSRNGFTR